MRFAAIDIGSNAVRLLIAEVIDNAEQLSIKKLSLTRVPIRLGESVFSTGRISEEKIRALEKTMMAYRYLIEIYEVAGFRACATSAMREAENSSEVVKRIKDHTDIDIEVIDGKIEADLIFSTFVTQKLQSDRDYLYVDVGGGSTEITLLKEGKRISSRSFKIGTVRILQGKVEPELWEEMERWVKQVTANEVELTAIGTGGNINRLFKMSKLGYGKLMSREKLEKMHKRLKGMTFEERVEKLRLRPDRADVIVPAGAIYTRVLGWANIEEMSVPKIGLSDGIALYLYRKEVGKTDKEA